MTGDILGVNQIESESAWDGVTCDLKFSAVRLDGLSLVWAPDLGPNIYRVVSAAAADAQPTGFCKCGEKLQSKASIEAGMCAACREKQRQIGPDRPKG